MKNSITFDTSINNQKIIKMKKLQASCRIPGYLDLPTSFYLASGFSTTGNYADYTFNSPETLLSVAKNYDNVIRNGKIIRGSTYTLKMAQNDFSKYAN